LRDLERRKTLLSSEAFEIMKKTFVSFLISRVSSPQNAQSKWENSPAAVVLRGREEVFGEVARQKLKKVRCGFPRRKIITHNDYCQN
jgi:hypothetical protein